MNMINKIFFIISVLLMASCGKVPSKYQEYPGVSALSTSYSSQTQNILKKFNDFYGTNYPVSQIFISPIGKYDPNTVGFCTSRGQIYIEENLLPAIFASVLLHELGHCVLKLDHTSSKTAHYRDRSIMGPTLIFYSPLELEYYLTHLKNFEDAKIDSLDMRQVEIPWGIRTQIYGNIYFIINPLCSRQDDRVICLDGQYNTAPPDRAEELGLSECGPDHYIKDLTSEEAIICESWKL